MALIQSSGVGALKTTRDKEKRDMQDLNERFANYIEKVRFLEAQNRKLSDELDKLKSKWGIETTKIKGMYEAELAEAKRLIEEAEKEKSRLEQRVAALEEQIEELRNKLEEATKVVAEIRERIEQQNQQLSDYEAEINALRRRLNTVENDRAKDKATIAQLQDALNRARIDLDNETLLHLDADNLRQGLEEDLEFLKQVHEQELKELAALAYRDTTSENREFWKNEMGGALRKIQEVYDEKMDDVRREMDTFYNLKVQEFRSGSTRHNMDAIHSKEESVRLRTQLQDLRAKLNDLENKNNMLQRELENLRRDKEEQERKLNDDNAHLRSNVATMKAELAAISKELQDLEDTKLTLELEIAAYRKLLEGEDNRQGLKQVVDNMFTSINSTHSSGPDDYTTVRSVMRGEMQAKTTNQRSAKGPTAIGDCAVDGTYVCIENSGRKEEDIGGWKVSRLLNGADLAGEFVLPAKFELKTNQKVKLWAKGKLPAGAKSDTDLETNVTNWGFGSNQILTKITNTSGEDRATLVQRTVAQS
jgi:intermediate filament protein if